ncbi:MAG: DUF3859 domain-containing protein [Desulfovibrio sp.]|jgi:hypothetical protein|nr:DUF3859 domain-containing protein [Desulfovibrio sp.]MBI4958548.1 DUF3859 domain-containing protein [Desulfovibrio sp.]
MSKVLVILFPLFLTACSMMGFGDTPNQLEIVEYGIFKNSTLVKQTNGIPREMGVSFGFRFKVKDAKAGPMKARIVTATPGLLDPSKPKTQMDYVTEVTIQHGQTYDVIFTFSEPWEMVAGHWELKVETQKGEILSQTFEIYKPNS